MKRICVFCGSSMGSKEIYKIKAKELGESFLKNELILIYGGANVGLMKILADTVLQERGEVIGVMPRSLVEKEVAHLGLSKMHITESMQERKVLMAEMSDAFIAMPGGFGTLDELAEMLTYNQLRIHDKPIGLLNIDGYFDHLLKFLDHAVEEQYVRKEHRKNIIVDDNIDALLEKLNNYKPVLMDKWIHEIKEESN
ncbi:MAG: TIGR00730 family Rossman fold protein [Bacteroidales bacterium]|nr:TIGR00730 family Rossman fold protein [Bacteroidales bacterium]